MEKSIKKETKLFYFGAFLSYFMNGIIGPLYIIYLLSININIAQIGLILAAQSVATLIFEFPTGIYADKYGRRNSLLISFGLTAILSLVWFLSRNFNILLMLAILGGIAYTFQSGARDSIMIKNLGLEENHSLRDRIFSRLSVFGNIGCLLGGLLAAGLAYYSISSIWLASVLINAILFVVYLLFIKEKNIGATDIAEIVSLFRHMLSGAKSTLSQIIRKKSIVVIILIAMIFSLAIGFYGLAYPVYFKEIIKIPNYYFGFLGSLSALMGIAGAFLGEKLIRKKGYYFTLGLFAVILVGLYLIFGFASLIWLSLIVFALIEMFINGWFPPFQSFFNKFISNKVRAGVLSFSSSLTLVVIALGNILIGYLLKIISANTLIVYSSVIFLFIPLLLLTVKKFEIKESHEKEKAVPSR